MKGKRENSWEKLEEHSKDAKYGDSKKNEGDTEKELHTPPIAVLPTRQNTP